MAKQQNQIIYIKHDIRLCKWNNYPIDMRMEKTTVLLQKVHMIH